MAKVTAIVNSWGFQLGPRQTAAEATWDAEKFYTYRIQRLSRKVLLELPFCHPEISLVSAANYRQVSALQNVPDVLSIDDHNFTGGRAFFMEICKRCYQAIKKRLVWSSTVNSTLSVTKKPLKLLGVTDHMNFGLFFPGPGSKSVELPHRLFQEYFTAVYTWRWGLEVTVYRHSEGISAGYFPNVLPGSYMGYTWVC